MKLPRQLVNVILETEEITNDTTEALQIASMTCINIQTVADKIKHDDVTRKFCSSFEKENIIISILKSAITISDVSTLGIKMIEPSIQQCSLCSSSLIHKRYNGARIYSLQHGCIDVLHYSKLCSTCNIEYFSEYYSQQLKADKKKRIYYNFQNCPFVTFSSLTIVEKEVLNLVKSIYNVSKISFTQSTEILNHYHRRHIELFETKMNVNSAANTTTIYDKKIKKRKLNKIDSSQKEECCDIHDELENDDIIQVSDKATFKRRYVFDKRHIWNCFIIYRLNVHVFEQLCFFFFLT